MTPQSEREQEVARIARIIDPAADEYAKEQSHRSPSDRNLRHSPEMHRRREDSLAKAQQIAASQPSWGPEREAIARTLRRLINVLFISGGSEKVAIEAATTELFALPPSRSQVGGDHSAAVAVALQELVHFCGGGQISDEGFLDWARSIIAIAGGSAVAPPPPPTLTWEGVEKIATNVIRRHVLIGDEDGASDMLDALATWMGNKTVAEAIEHVETMAGYIADKVMAVLTAPIAGADASATEKSGAK